MHWEASNPVDLAGPGWHPDPFDPTRQRWWDGTTWSARVARFEPGSDAISWRADIADLAAPTPQVVAPPIAVPPAAVPTAAVPTAAVPEALAEPPAPALLPSALLTAPPPAVEPAVDEAESPSRPHPRRNRRAWAALAVAVLVIAAGAGVGTAMLGNDERPTVAEQITYRDDDTDFALKYPEAWHVSKPAADEEPTPGAGIKFIVGSTSVPTDEQNTVSVVAGTTPQPAIRLDDLVASTAADLMARNLVNFRLVSATEARLAGGPAFRTEFVDSTTKPGVRLVGYTGRTASGRLLIVNITVREPRTQAADDELDEFLASITSS